MRRALIAAIILGLAPAMLARVAPAQEAPARDAGASRFSFDQFPATERFTGRAAPADFATNPEVRRFAAHIDGAVRRPVNFAGSWTIVTWPCLSLCVSVVAVDKRTGRIVAAPEAYNGLSFRSDSRLLIINPAEHIPPALRANPPAEIRPEYYEFTGTEFRRLDYPDVNATGTFRAGDPLPSNLPRPETDIPGTGWGSGQFGAGTDRRGPRR
jgi:hypothetical protein